LLAAALFGLGLLALLFALLLDDVQRFCSPLHLLLRQFLVVGVCRFVFLLFVGGGGRRVCFLAVRRRRRQIKQTHLLHPPQFYTNVSNKAHLLSLESGLMSRVFMVRKP
jgi:hypothetical protein